MMQRSNSFTIYRLLNFTLLLLFLTTLIYVGYLTFSRTEKNILQHIPLYRHLSFRARLRTDSGSSGTDAPTYKSTTDSSTTGHSSSKGAPTNNVPSSTQASTTADSSTTGHSSSKGAPTNNVPSSTQASTADSSTTGHSSSKGAPTNNVPSSTQASIADSSTTGHSSSTGAANMTAEQTKKPHVILVVNIITAPSRLDRREAVRATWLKDCSGPEVVCNFFTDPLSELDANERNAISSEIQTHDDLKFMPVPRGYNFGRRILWLIEWSTQNYDFDFHLRVDDDYFVCLKKLLLELPHRPKTTRMNWGFLHCTQLYGTRIDEGFMIFSAALAQEFLSQKDTLLCGPYGGSTVGVWLNNVTNVTIFHDARLFHGISSGNARFKNLQEICKTWLGLHGSYPVEMQRYWSIASNETIDKYDIPPIKPVKEVCRYEIYYDWRKDGGTEPKLCRLKHVYNKGKMHRGRG